MGETSFGNPIEINAEVVSHPLKIAIGSIVLHPLFGFGEGRR